MTVNFKKDKFNLREKLKELERPSVDKLVTKDENGAYIDTIRGTTKLESIDSVIPDTAVDIFIYDTSKDSDGGAWRHRTTHTSWYNEELNTTTRGSRKEFPAVAVIVAETAKVTIYDGDDPDLPMWMVFNRSSNSTSTMLGSNVTSPVSVYMLNGILCVCLPSGGWGVSEIRFLSDSQRWVWGGYPYPDHGQIANTIVERNVASSYSGPGAIGGGLVSGLANDLAMTVLPNAPIDSATGLPIPTIAVATNGGVSVIKDDGTVVDITETTGPNSVREVTFRKSDGKLGFRWSDTSGNSDYLHVGYCPIPSSDKSVNYFYAFSQSTFPGWEDHPYNQGGTDFSDAYPSIMPTGSPGEDGTALIDNNIGTSLGLVRINENPASPANGLGAYITSDYNTGWMHGNIKGAFLSDTDATNVTNTELVTNGTFDSDSGWVKENGTVTISGGTLNFTNSGNNIDAYQIITTEVGKTYVATLDVTSYTSGQIRLYAYSNGSFLPGFGFRSSTGQVTHTFTAPATETRIYVYAYNTPVTLSVDNVSVRIADPDRSVNNKGLQVFGTVTKSAVATGAELVKYGGFGSGVNANGLVQPYNSDMDWGTGDFYYMVWVYHRDIASLYGIISRQRLGQSSGNRFQFQTDNDGRYDLYSGSNQNDLGSIRLNTWSHLAIVRSGSTVNFYQDGISVRSWSDSTNYTNSTAPLRVGGLSLGSTINDNSYGASGVDFALFRTGASAPSAEQIKKIYEDEKVLFQDNAACTLYGSSDAVTALAYDEVTERLHVGTSSGRSEFQGLRRINNTTTAVTTAISAYDSFVVEQ